MTGCCGGGEVWIDPAELDATATLLSTQAARIQEAAATSCCGTGLAYVDEALAAATAEASRIAAAYLTEAGDLNHRATEVVLEEATQTTTAASAASGPAVVPESMTLTGTTGTGSWTTSVIGGPGAGLGADAFPATGGFQQLQPGDMGYLGGLEGLVASTLAGHGGGTGSANVSGDAVMTRLQMELSQSQSDAIGTILAPSGLTMDNGEYVDASGNRGSISDVRPDYYNPDNNHIEP